jgi:hypothetical protein
MLLHCLQFGHFAHFLSQLNLDISGLFLKIQRRPSSESFLSLSFGLSCLVIVQNERYLSWVLFKVLKILLHILFELLVDCLSGYLLVHIGALLSFA